MPGSLITSLLFSCCTASFTLAWLHHFMHCYATCKTTKLAAESRLDFQSVCQPSKLPRHTAYRHRRLTRLGNSQRLLETTMPPPPPLRGQACPSGSLSCSSTHRRTALGSGTAPRALRGPRGAQPPAPGGGRSRAKGPRPPGGPQADTAAHAPPRTAAPKRDPPGRARSSHSASALTAMLPDRRA